MADRYWTGAVNGGTGTWDTTNTANWSNSSGGAGGFSAPTAADNVYFDANSGTGTCTMSGSLSCFNLSFAGSGAINASTGYPTSPSWYAGTLTGGTALTVYGNYIISESMIWAIAPSNVNLSATTTGNYIYHPDTIATDYTLINFNGVGGAWSLFGAYFYGSPAITITAGAVTISSGYLFCASISVSGALVKSLTLNSTTHYTDNIIFNGTTNFTFTPNTSTIYTGSITGVSSTINTTFYNVYLYGGTSNASLLNLLTFNDLRILTSSNNTIYRSITFNTSPLTINGQFYTTTDPTYLAMSRVQFLYYGSTSLVAGIVTCNGTTNLTNIDFKNVYVNGTAAPISGTRIGNLGGCKGITFDAQKTVYWGSSLSTGAWNSLGWSLTSGGAATYAAFPLPQDIAKFDNSSGVGGSLSVITFNSVYGWLPTVDMSSRTTSMTASTAAAVTIYGDWKNGSLTTLSGSAIITFSGRNNQTITSAGKTFASAITISSIGGVVQLADALNIGSSIITVDHGTFNTNGQAVSAARIQTSTAYPCAINLGSSTLSLLGSTAVSFGNPNLSFNAGSSTINITSTTSAFVGGGKTFNNVNITSTAGTTYNITGANTFANLSVTPPAAVGLTLLTFAANQTITGTFTCAGATAVRRISVQTNSISTGAVQRILTVGTLSAQDCDFKYIAIAGTAAGTAPTRAGNCGNNSGITFPSPKTVYWNLAGAQNWSAIGWCTNLANDNGVTLESPNINNFPLAQDTARFNNTGSVTGLITIDKAWNIGTFNASTRTTAMTLSISTNLPYVHGDWLFGTGVSTSTTTGTLNFGAASTQTITSNGVTFNFPINFNPVTGTVQLSGSFTSSSTLVLSSGTFIVGSNNVTVSGFSTGTATLYMGSGTWTLTGTGSIFFAPAGGLTLYMGTANIILTDNSAVSRTFAGAGLSYNKLTIGGAGGSSSTLTISGNNNFSEIASTKTVAHTIALGTTTQTFGAWTVTGTAGNVVTVTGTALLTIAGARVSGVDYLALGTITISATSPGEFYAGVNSTGGTNAILTAAPTPVTRYWRGGNGTWDATTTTNWSATSGGSGGASVPTSADAVIFNSASNATAYTVTLTATQLRCGSLTVTGPNSGNVSFAGTAPLAVHGNLTFPTTGMTQLYTWNGTITLSGSSTGKVYTPNGAYCPTGNTIEVNGVGSGWTLGSTEIGFFWRITAGTFDTGNYTFYAALFTFVGTATRVVNFGSSTVDCNSNFSSTTNLTFNAGTSTLLLSSSSSDYQLGGLSYNNVSLTSIYNGIINIGGANTFANLSIAGKVGAGGFGISFITFSANQTITGTLTLSAGDGATYRNFLRSDTIGTTRTMTVGAFAAGSADIDFRDIAIVGAAAPISGTRFGDCKGNSGITFNAGTNKYWNLAAGGYWGDTAWTTTSGGTADLNNFPLAQDTAWIESANLNSGATIIMDWAWNIGTINMSGRTTNTMTLDIGATTPQIYGDWINGSGVIISGTGNIYFSGRGSQTIRSAGAGPFTGTINITAPGGSVTLADAIVGNFISLIYGTFNANDKNVTIGGVDTNNSNVRTLAMGSGLWTLSFTAAWTVFTPTNLTVTGTGTIKLTSASPKTFTGGGVNYSGITIDQGGGGLGNLTITGNNIFKNITNSYGSTGASSIILGTTTQTVSQFTATGTVGKVLTISGSAPTGPASLIYTGTSDTTSVDYITATDISFYVPDLYWKIGTNSKGTFSGAYLMDGTIPSYSSSNSNFFLFF